MLYTDEEHSPYPNSYGQDAYGLEYLNRLFAASSDVLEKQCNALWQAAGILTKEEKDALGKEIKLQAHTNALWKTLSNVSYESDYFYASGIEIFSGQFLYGSRIHDLTFTDAGFTYNCEYQTAWVGDASMGVCGKNISELVWHGENLLTVQTKILTNLNEMKIEEHIEEIQALRTEREFLFTKYFLKTGMNIIGSVFPITGGLCDTLNGALDKSASDINGGLTDTLEEIGLIDEDVLDGYKSGAGPLVSIGAGLVDYFNEAKQIDKKSNAEKELQKIKLFGAVSSFTAGGLSETVNMGYYNPESLFDLRTWEKSGIDGVLGKALSNGEKREEVIKEIRQQLEGKMTAGIATLLDGGNIFLMDATEISEAISSINQAYKAIETDDKYFGSELNLLAIFQEK